MRAYELPALQYSQPRSRTSDYVRVLQSMMYDEPCVMSAIRLLQARCLRTGVHVRWGHTPPTPAFGNHLRRYYEPFCRDAIAAAVAVGFVPYRIRQEGAHSVPEVLPFGTYTWSVMRSDQRIFGVDDGAGPRKRKHGPLLEYVISTSVCSTDQIRVRHYTTPDATLSCTSPLASLITAYNRLLQMRRNVENSEIWNSHPSIVFEEKDKSFINAAAEKGTGFQLSKPSIEISANESAASYQTRLELTQRIHADMRAAGSLPDDCSLLFAPCNYTARCLDKAELPGDQMQRELAFTRSVAMALGLPTSVLLQGASAVGGSSAGTGNQWMDGPACTERAMLDACCPLVHMLEELLTLVYKEVYDSPNVPTFKLCPAPTLSTEQLLQLYDARLLADEPMSQILESNVGCGTGPDAKAAMQDRHRAVNVLPFKDKKDT